jgi:hypothetical protein
MTTPADALRAREERRTELQQADAYAIKVRPFLDALRADLEAARVFVLRIEPLKREHGAWFDEQIADLGAPPPPSETRRLRDLHHEARTCALGIKQMLNKGPELEAVIARLDNWTPEDTGTSVPASLVPHYHAKLSVPPTDPAVIVADARRTLERLLPEIAAACAAEPLRITSTGGRGALPEPEHPPLPKHALSTTAEHEREDGE